MTINKDSPWGIDRLNEQVKGISEEQKAALNDECMLYGQCFGTAAGIKILEIIKEELDSQPTWNPSLDPKYGYYREGQNDVIRHIINRIKYARGIK